MIGPETFVLPLQNGLEAPAQLSEILGDQHVLGGLCGLFCYVAGPGHIVHAGTDPFVKFGELDNHRSQRVELLLDTFKRAGVNAEIPPDIQVAMWMKFMFVDSVEWNGGGNACSSWDMAQPARDSPNGGTEPSGNYCRSDSSRYFIARKSLANDNDHV